MKQKKYYTILLGHNIWQNVIDDMNTAEIWATGGMIWNSEKKAMACLRNLLKYDFETKNKKFSVKQLYF
jgi:hypothetical protein